MISKIWFERTAENEPSLVLFNRVSDNLSTKVSYLISEECYDFWVPDTNHFPGENVKEGVVYDKPLAVNLKDGTVLDKSYTGILKNETLYGRNADGSPVTDRQAAGGYCFKNPTPTYQLRVMEEQLALNDKLGKLEAFFSTELFKKLSLEEQCRLHRQSLAMEQYSDILEERIKAF